MSRQLALLWGGVAATLMIASPWASGLTGGLWACAFKSWTGYACPSCGTTRAALLLAELDFATALSLYPLPALGWILFLGGGLAAAVVTLVGQTPPGIPTRLTLTGRVAIVSAVGLNWAYSIATGV